MKASPVKEFVNARPRMSACAIGANGLLKVLGGPNLRESPVLMESSKFQTNKLFNISMKLKKYPSRSAVVPCGVYRHYKGQHYLVIGVAKHSETEEDFVVYVRLYARGGCPLWIRPLEHFTGKVKTPVGRWRKRFSYVGLKQPAE